MAPRASTKALLATAATPTSIASICSSCFKKEFSSTASTRTRLRRRMFAWLNGPGETFKHPVVNATNYLSASNSESSDRPFPLNPMFTSQSILSESLRHEIWKRVQVEKKSVRQVSVELGVEMRRIGAVVRLVEIERKARAEGKPLAVPYARAIHSMVPTTPYDSASRTATPHEPINDLPVHPLTNPQIFYPTSESRSFNRVDAGRVFSGAPRLSDTEDVGQGGIPAVQPWENTKVEIIGKKGHETAVLKPADARIPHPHLIAFEQDKKNPAFRGEEDEIKQRYATRLYDDARDREVLRAKKFAQEEASRTRIDTSRWEIIVTEAQVTREGTGSDGRGHKSPGNRYGVPSQDRKRGQIKIPTRVQV